MSAWGSAKAREVLRALQRIGWGIKRQSGSHRTLARQGWPDYTFAFHDGEEIGPKMMSRVAQENRADASRFVNSSHFLYTMAHDPIIIAKKVKLRLGGKALRWENLDEDIWIGHAVMGRYPASSRHLAAA